jgi:hypothetical protein
MAVLSFKRETLLNGDIARVMKGIIVESHRLIDDMLGYALMIFECDNHVNYFAHKF